MWSRATLWNPAYIGKVEASLIPLAETPADRSGSEENRRTGRETEGPSEHRNFVGASHPVQFHTAAAKLVKRAAFNPDILCGMIIGAHFLIYSRNPEADRAFFRDVLGFPAVDVGGGWLIFGMSPAEAAIHPSDGEFSQRHAGHELLGAVLYLMCDDLDALIAALQAKNVHCTEVQTADWGIATTIPLPSGGNIGLYQPTHPTALHLTSK
jgi:catechol 2,3-dioxygenase-like lactoylglutathione lyase family enzyme